MNRGAILHGIEALFFLAIGIDFIRRSDMGGGFALSAGVLAVMRAGSAVAAAIRGERLARGFRWFRTAILAALGLVLVAGTAYSFSEGTSAPVVHGLLGVLGLVLLVAAAFEARSNRKR